MSTTTSRVFPEGRHGVFEIKRSVDDTYYKFIDGLDQDGQPRQLVTRGPGREKGATRIPIRLPVSVARSVIEYAKTEDMDLQSHAWGTFMHWYLHTPGHIPDKASEPLLGLTVPLVIMPRGGNLVSGLEWNAPGGTAQLNESFAEIGTREFDEETGVAVLGVESPFPPCMFASGIYDEVQSVSFALITGSPTRLVEGAKGWHQVPLVSFCNWATAQNQQDHPARWQTSKYVPVDGKVVFALWWLTETTGLNSRL